MSLQSRDGPSGPYRHLPYASRRPLMWGGVAFLLTLGLSYGPRRHTAYADRDR
jgi:hypothetical protein